MAAQLANVAAIDFGTTFCSLSYAINGGEIKMLDIYRNDNRVPTALLLKKNKDGSVLLIDIGVVAQQKYVQFSEDIHEEHLYFECFKMNLRDEEV